MGVYKTTFSFVNYRALLIDRTKAMVSNIHNLVASYCTWENYLNTNNIVRNIWGYEGDKGVDVVLGCKAAYTFRQIPMIRWNVPPPSLVMMLENIDL
jgi:Ni,Fe-hydrogenase I small subunit